MTYASRPSEQAVTFPYGSSTAYGILHRPSCDSPNRDTALIFINAGLRTRCGPQRLYTRFARHLSTAGYHVLRYDPPGIGEGPGTLSSPEEYRQEVFGALETNADTVDFLVSTTGVSNVGIFGLCGGAYRAMVAAALDRRIQFLILAGLPVPPLGDLSTNGIMEATMQSYLLKARRLSTWYRLFKGQIDLRWLFRVLGHMLTRSESSSTIDPDLYRASVSYCSGGRQVLFIYGSADWLYPPFANDFLINLTKKSKSQQCIQLHVVEDADHVFSRMHWQTELIGTATAWLGNR